MVDRRGLDELIKFINGAEENMGMGGATHIDRNTKASGKAAKRQRQKQRKVSCAVLFCWVFFPKAKLKNIFETYLNINFVIALG